MNSKKFQEDVIVYIPNPKQQMDIEDSNIDKYLKSLQKSANNDCQKAIN